MWGSIRTTQLFVQNFSSDSSQIAILSWTLVSMSKSSWPIVYCRSILGAERCIYCHTAVSIAVEVLSCSFCLFFPFNLIIDITLSFCWFGEWETKERNRIISNCFGVPIYWNCRGRWIWALERTREDCVFAAVKRNSLEDYTTNITNIILRLKWKYLDLIFLSVFFE